MAKSNYNGIEVSKSSITLGDEITITYNGYLASNGAESIYAHMGYNESWEEQAVVPMKKEKSGLFKAKIKVTNPGSLNFCFKDGWDNWDNNYSNNYSFQVSSKKPKDMESTAGTENLVEEKAVKAATIKASTTKTEKAGVTKAATTKTVKAATSIAPKSKTAKAETTKTATKTVAKATTKTADNTKVSKSADISTAKKTTKPATKQTTAKKTTKK